MHRNLVNLLCWSQLFLPTKQLQEVYFKVILPSVLYSQTVWGSCNKTCLYRLEKLHARDMSSENMLERAGWVPLSAMYKNRLAQFVYRVVNGLLPQEMLRLFRTKATRYNLKNRHALIYTSKTRDKLFEKLNSLSRSHLVEQLTSEHEISWWHRQF